MQVWQRHFWHLQRARVYAQVWQRHFWHLQRVRLLSLDFIHCFFISHRENFSHAWLPAVRRAALQNFSGVGGVYYRASVCARLRTSEHSAFFRAFRSFLVSVSGSFSHVFNSFSCLFFRLLFRPFLRVYNTCASRSRKPHPTCTSHPVKFLYGMRSCVLC